MQLNIKEKKKESKQSRQKTGRRPKQIFLQRRQTDGQETHEKMLNIIHYQRNANQNYNEVLPHTGQNDHYLQAINAGEGVEKRESSWTICWNVN